MSNRKIISKIRERKEFSGIPQKDIEIVLDSFKGEDLVEEDLVKKSRFLLKKMYTVFASNKLFNLKNKSPEWILNRHTSSKERLKYYPEIYSRIFKSLKGKNFSVIDIGAGINGFSLLNYKINYLALEPVKQLVDLMNFYFKKKKLQNFNAIQESLFDLEKIRKFVFECTSPRIIFLFKVLDSLEKVKRNYSKRVLKELSEICEKIVVSFATESLIRKNKFFATRKWLVDFISENFKIVDDFEKGGERYIIFSKKQNGPK